MLIDFRQLFPRWNIKPKGVLHVGANVGEEAPVYLELGIKRQIWIEANPEIFERLRENIKENLQAASYCYCISDVDDEKVQFHVSNNASQSSSILELGTHLIAHPEVRYIRDIEMETCRLDTIFNKGVLPPVEGYDFLNMDLQGAELKALKSLGDLLHHFKWAYLEVNKEELYKGCSLVWDIDTYMAGFGFRRVETLWCGQNGWGDCLYVKT